VRELPRHAGPLRRGYPDPLRLTPRTPTEADPRSVTAQSRLEEDPRLKTMIDYLRQGQILVRDRAGAR